MTAMIPMKMVKSDLQMKVKKVKVVKRRRLSNLKLRESVG